MASLGIDDDPPLNDIEKQATVRMLLQSRSGERHPVDARDYTGSGQSRAGYVLVLQQLGFQRAGHDFRATDQNANQCRLRKSHRAADRHGRLSPGRYAVPARHPRRQRCDGHAIAASSLRVRANRSRHGAIWLPFYGAATGTGTRSFRRSGSPKAPIPIRRRDGGTGWTWVATLTFGGWTEWAFP